MFCKQINLSEEEKNSIGILLDGKEYSAQQFHFHFKSEHQIGSQQFPLEMHIVHKSAQGNFAVVGVLYEITKETGLVYMYDIRLQSCCPITTKLT